MNPNCTKTVFFLPVILLLTMHSRSQVCSNPRDTVYTLNTTGLIYRINVNDAGVGPAFPALTTGNPAENSNGLAFSSLYGKFYYFHRSAAVAAPYHEFVSYDPATSTLQLLATIPIANNRKIRSGTMNNDGTGYYTIDPAGPTLYYYSIASNTWTAITSSFVDPSNTSLNTTFNTLNSGDMAFDGNGNLWMLLAKSNSYALFKIPAPVPTGVQASVTAQEMIAPTVTPNNKSITGLAFNSDGNMYMSTGTGDNKLYRMSTVTSGLTEVGTFATDDIGADLTSCYYPFFVLPAVWHSFTAQKHNGIALTWTVQETEDITGYTIEHSTNGTNFTKLAYVEKEVASSNSGVTYTYTHHQYALNNNYYRIVQMTTSGKRNISAIRLVHSNSIPSKIYIGPNPVQDALFINMNDTEKYLAQVFDRSGRLLYTTVIGAGQQYIPVAGLSKGTYILKLTTALSKKLISYQFVKN